MKIRSLTWSVLLALVLLPAALEAQVFTPSYLAPRQSADRGIHISDGFARGGGLAVEGLWRFGFGGYDLGLRSGVGEADGDAYLLLGGDYRRPLALGTDPIDLAVTGGAQVGIGSDSFFGFDVGVTLGSTFTPEGIGVTPYLHPRLALVSIRDEERDRTGLAVLADLGVEVEVQPNFLIRLALGFGSETAAFGIGLAWR
jgi:hypothetical protein